MGVVKGTEVLEAFIDKLEIEYPEKPYHGNVYSASFVVDADGYYKKGSLQIAPFIWVIYQMMCQPDIEFKDIKLDGWDEVVKKIEIVLIFLRKRYPLIRLHVRLMRIYKRIF